MATTLDSQENTCKKYASYVYSSHTIEALRELIDTLRDEFSACPSLDDMFSYSVLCKAETYANYKWYGRFKVEVPNILLDELQSTSSKMDFVKKQISLILDGEPKPEWMIEVEESASFNEFNDMPSTFLYLKPKEERFKKLAISLINFLYSPNLMTTLLNK